MHRSTLTSKGQVTIPKQVRESLGLKMGDRLVFKIEGDGRLVVQREQRDPLEGLSGRLRHLATGRPPLTDEEMNQAIARHHAEENERIRGYSQ